MHNFKKGDIVWANVCFSDYSESKARPVLVINQEEDDFLVLFITTMEKPNSVAIELKKKSFIKISRPLFIHKNNLGKKIKSIPSEIYDDIILKFIKFQTKFTINKKIKVS